MVRSGQTMSSLTRLRFCHSPIFSNIYLIENLSELWYDDECDKFQSLPSMEKEAIEHKKTFIVFVSSNDPCVDESFIKSRLL
jgi:hypothetical protein